MKNKPFFSIVIATYSRAKDLEFALKQIFTQTYKNFEVIVVDDNSYDNTKEICNKFTDKRLRYYRNKKNLGAVKNIGKSLSYVQGKYVFLHGDDDYLLYSNILKEVHDLIEIKNYGLIRLGYLYQTFDKQDVFDYGRNKGTVKSFSINKNKNSIDILEFIKKIDLFFISGIIFKSPNNQIKITDSELMPWFKVCFMSIAKLGAYFNSETKIIASWSHQKKHPAFYVTDDGKLPFEAYYNELKSIDSDYYEVALKRELEISVTFFSSIKYNSNNANLIKYAKRVLFLNKNYNYSLKFWILLISALLLPKYILRLVRMIYIKKLSNNKSIKDYNKIIKQIHFLRNK